MNEGDSLNNLVEDALEIRQEVYKILCRNKAGHLASSFSAVEILTSIYLDKILKYRINEPDWSERDRFILSKGHAALAYYVTLSKAGFFPLDEVYTFCIAGTKYGALPVKGKIKGVEATTGSLGHGLSYAAGIATYAKLYKKDFKVYVLIGDGETQEGTIWEAAMYIKQNNLTNLVTIIDFNKIQATDRCENIISVDNMKEKWEAFGFEVWDIDGHNFAELKEALVLNETIENPRVVIANTIKGKGLSFLENRKDSHYFIPDEKQILIGQQELGVAF